MRFIPTFDVRVEQLKLEAKKIQRKRGGKHTELLDRVARGAGYDHWHHVIQCQRQTAAKQGGQVLLAECASIVRAEQAGDVKVVMTGPEMQVGPFVLFSTGLGDAWLLSPEEDLALCLMWHGQVNKLQITETAHELHRLGRSLRACRRIHKTGSRRRSHFSTSHRRLPLGRCA